MTPPYLCEARRGPDGRIIEKTETVRGRKSTWSYEYDEAGRLTKAQLDGRLICQCWYDREGRRVRDYLPATAGANYREYQYTQDNRLMRAGSGQYSHDERGFRSIWSARGVYTLYEYAPDYRLLKAEEEDRDKAFTFRHDEDGQRTAKYLNGELVEAYQWLDFVRLAGFHDGQHGHEFAYRDGERTPFAMRRDDGTVAGLFYDQVGSLRLVVDMHDNVIKEIVYDPFGGIIEDTNPAQRIPLGFAGGLHDRDLGFVRFGWRDYDVKTGRWTAPDPIGEKGGDPDWYGYCLDDPVNAVDPAGLWTNEHGEEISKGRPITEYFPGIGTPFSAMGTKRNVQKGLRDKKADYSDENDWEMRKNLETEAEGFGFWDAVLGTYRFKTDDGAVEHYVGKAKSTIGKN
ncbi:RHS repeat domain-containing protein [Pseudodesulfovibrio indicus]|uniref:RHS repeat-associated protein n=1 Tax=Pseudodesulfovibrio indicus TaxID=1716143 RepID=A0AA94TID6_9BACT|nr:RHS repeat-associated core domain-containing protein [Pseudodesulfovibrio indicus]TDT86996.1 RHS repeat-associated protein [Pseudodesulfovibrio indicus]